IGPPGFMAMIYTNAIKGSLSAERQAEHAALTEGAPVLDAARQQRLDFLNGLVQQFHSRAGEAELLKSQANPKAQQSARLDAPEHRQRYGAMITDAEAEAIDQIGKTISDPMNARLINTPDGGKAAELSPLATQLLGRTGNSYWYVPDGSTTWYKSARALI